MVDVSRVNSSPTFQPVPVESPLVEEISELALEKGVNLAQLIAKTYNLVEQVSHTKSHVKIDELEKHEKKLRAVTEFLSEIENQLTKSKEINMDNDKHKVVIDALREMLDHKVPLLDKNYVWTKDEAELLKTALTRHSQIIMQQVHHSSSQVNRAIEEGTELLQIARKLLEMIDRLHNTFTSNQRGR